MLLIGVDHPRPFPDADCNSGSFWGQASQGYYLPLPSVLKSPKCALHDEVPIKSGLLVDYRAGN